MAVAALNGQLRLPLAFNLLDRYAVHLGPALRRTGIALERLGIADQVNAKAKLQKGTFAGSPAEDHGEIGITQPMEILATPGFELAGWLPPELQDYEKFTWSMGVTSNAKEATAGEALVKFLSSPTAAALIKKKGMEPGAQ